MDVGYYFSKLEKSSIKRKLRGRKYASLETFAEWILARNFNARWKFSTAATYWL